MNSIKNIIFDLGGIFLDVDYQKTEQAFIAAGVNNFAGLYAQDHASMLFEDLETGKIAPLQFYEAFRKKANINLSNQQIMDAWNAMLGNFLWDELHWLQNIQHKYRIFLYSNTNQIHYDAFSKTFMEATGNKNFENFFIKAYYSHTFGMRKPYQASYQKLMQEQNLLPAQTIFIDDTIKNIQGAKLAGLQTIHLIPSQRVSQLGL